MSANAPSPPVRPSPWSVVARGAVGGLALALGLLPGACSGPAAGHPAAPSPPRAAARPGAAPGPEERPTAWPAERLLAAPAPVGREEVLVGLLREEVERLTSLSVQADEFGLVLRAPGATGAPDLVVAVGIDEPGHVVSAIEPDGWLRLRTLGADDAAALALATEGRPVTVLGSRGPVDAVVAVDNLHLRAPRPDPLGEQHLFVDVGADDPAGVAALGIRLLDPVVPRRDLVPLARARFAAPAAGTRAICGALLDWLARCAGPSGDGLPPGVAVAFVGQTRVGGRGAAGPLQRGGERLARRLQPVRVLVLGPAGDLPGAVRGPVSTQGPGADWSLLELRVAHAGTPVETVAGEDLAGLEAALEGIVGALPGARVPIVPVAGRPAPPPVAAARDPVHPDTHLALAARLAELSAAEGVSGHEGAARRAVAERLRQVDPAWEPVTDPAGNLVLTLGDGPRALVFAAHLDEIGLRVTALRDDGRLLAEPLGGFFDHLYRQTALDLFTGTGRIGAVSLPASSDPAAADRLFVLDVGAGSRADAEALGVAVGDVATVPKELLRLGEHRAAGRALDDRAGCTALLVALERLSARAAGDPSFAAEWARRLAQTRLVFAWTTQEEVGLLGADHLARTLRPVPGLVFAVDTFVTSDSPRHDPYWAHAPLGAGPVLRALDNTSITPRAMLDRMESIARGAGLAVQVNTMGGGNDGSRFVPEGATDCPLAWPQRNSHSRVETLDLRDLDALADLVAAAAMQAEP